MSRFARLLPLVLFLLAFVPEDARAAYAVATIPLGIPATTAGGANTLLSTATVPQPMQFSYTYDATTCASGPAGTVTTTTAPTQGSITSTAASQTIPAGYPCAGKVMQGVQASYAYTATVPNGTGNLTPTGYYFQCNAWGQSGGPFVGFSTNANDCAQIYVSTFCAQNTGLVTNCSASPCYEVPNGNQAAGSPYGYQTCPYSYYEPAWKSTVQAAVNSYRQANFPVSCPGGVATGTTQASCAAAASPAVSNPVATSCSDRVTTQYSSQGLSQSTATNTSSCAKDLGCPTCSNPGRGEPITISNGNVFEAATDYATADKRLQFIRYYNSRQSSASTATSLGRGWRTTYDRAVWLTSPTTAIAERANGQQLNFASIGSAWVGDDDTGLTLTRTGSGWTLTDRDDTTETYTTSAPVAGLAVTSVAPLASISLRNGYTQTLTRTSGQVTSVGDSFGRTLTLTYANGMLTGLKTPDGQSFTYTVTGGYLTGVGYPTSPATSIAYSYTNTLLTGLTDENGKVFSTWAYDSLGRAVSNHMGSGSAGQTTVVYNTDGSRTVTNELGESKTYKFVPFEGGSKMAEIDRAATSTTAAASRTFTYDDSGNLAFQTDWNGNQTGYTYDSRGNLTALEEAVGSSVARSTNFTYSPTFHLPLTITGPWNSSTTFTYDTRGNPLTKTVTGTNKNTSTSRVWTYTWSNYNLASVKGPRTDASELTSFTYDATGALTKIVDPLGHATQITSHKPGGLPLTVVDSNNVTTTYTYDGRLRPLTQSVATSAGAETTTRAYDNAGNLIRLTLPDGSYHAMTYDDAHRLVQVADNTGAYAAYTLDALGDRTAVAEYGPGGAAKVSSHAYTFDALGRLLKSTSPVTNASYVYTYDGNGNRLSATDPLQHATSWAYDALNRPITITDPANNTIAQTWTALDELYTVIDQNGHWTVYYYDDFGDMTSLGSPDMGSQYFTYDLDGRLAGKSDTVGKATNWTYDAAGRVTGVGYPNAPAENTAYTWDQAGHGFGIGRVTGVTDDAGTLSRSYDERGNVLGETRVTGGVTLSTAWAYDAASRVAKVTYPSGWSAAYTRNAVGQVTGVGIKSANGALANAASGVTYTGMAGLPTGLTYGNGVVRTATYDLDYRPVSLVDTGASAVLSLAYGYDNANNVHSLADGVSSGNSQSFLYDSSDRLASASGVYGAYSWTYDKVGNRLSETVGSLTPVTYGYVWGNNQLTGTSGASGGELLVQRREPDERVSGCGRHVVELHVRPGEPSVGGVDAERGAAELRVRLAGPDGDAQRDEHDAARGEPVPVRSGRASAGGAGVWCCAGGLRVSQRAASGGDRAGRRHGDVPARRRARRAAGGYERGEGEGVERDVHAVRLHVRAVGQRAAEPAASGSGGGPERRLVPQRPARLHAGMGPVHGKRPDRPRGRDEHLRLRAGQPVQVGRSERAECNSLAYTVSICYPANVFARWTR